MAGRLHIPIYMADKTCQSPSATSERMDLMVPPVVPRHNLIFILVARGRCIVARFVETAPYVFVVERAQNWETLEEAAREIVTG